MLDYFIYDTSSPSCLSWSEDATPNSPKSGERKAGTHVGSLCNNVWHVQVISEYGRERSTAHRVIWALFNGTIPDNSVIIHLNSDTSDCRIENLMMVSCATHNYLKAWRKGTANVVQLPSGRWYATLRGYKSLGTYDTYEEAASIYRTTLQQLLITHGVPL